MHATDWNWIWVTCCMRTVKAKWGQHTKKRQRPGSLKTRETGMESDKNLTLALMQLIIDDPFWDKKFHEDSTRHHKIVVKDLVPIKICEGGVVISSLCHTFND